MTKLGAKLRARRARKERDKVVAEWKRLMEKYYREHPNSDRDEAVETPKEKPKAKLYGEFVGIEAGDEDKYKKAFRAVLDGAIEQMAEIEPDVPMSFEIIVNHQKGIMGEGFNWYEKEGLGKPKEIFTIGYKFAAVPFEHLVEELERFNKYK